MSDKRNQTKKYDVLVVGGGMPGICAETNAVPCFGHYDSFQDSCRCKKT